MHWRTSPTGMFIFDLFNALIDKIYLCESDEA